MCAPCWPCAAPCALAGDVAAAADEGKSSSRSPLMQQAEEEGLFGSALASGDVVSFRSYSRFTCRSPRSLQPTARNEARHSGNARARLPVELRLINQSLRGAQQDAARAVNNRNRHKLRTQQWLARTQEEGNRKEARKEYLFSSPCWLFQATLSITNPCVPTSERCFDIQTPNQN